MSEQRQDKLGFNAAWSMAVGGMIGGGIFATLGVVVQIAGPRAWISFVLAALVALATGHSYATLTCRFKEPGGFYRFLKEMDRGRIAAVTSWVLIAGYTLTISVYGYAFGAYVANVLGGTAWSAPALAAAVIILIAALNLIGTGEASTAEIVAVWFKVVILVALAALGLSAWNPDALQLQSASDSGWQGVMIGVGTVFMGYEGFQFLTYDYDDLEGGARLIARVIPAAILAAAAIYVGVVLGTVMLVGADQVIAHREVALAEAGRVALGQPGFVAVTLAAAMSTASAINATLFATARLTREVATESDLPRLLAASSANGSPHVAISLISAAALMLALVGGLTGLVQASGLVFLLVFLAVNLIALRETRGRRWVAAAGALGALTAALLLAASLLGWF